jgi:iron complex transport system permease protein
MRRALTFGRWCMLLLAYAVPFALVLAVAPFIGSESLGGPDILRLRLPRVILGLLAGGGLALAGAAFQVILRNPLAEPFTLGVTGGSAVGAVLALSVPALAFSVGPFSTVQVLSLIGAAFSLGLIYRLAKRPHGISMNTLLLAGVTVSILSAGAIMFIRYLANPYALMSMNRWLMGGLDVIGYRDLAALLPFYLPGLVLLLLQAPALNQLSLGEEMAAGHGVEVAMVQRWSFLGGGLLTAAIVSLTGPIGFVGLIVPHAVRRLSGFDQRVVLPASFLLGGAFLAACDTAARTLLAPLELPVGVVTALIGGPLFIRILLGRRR